MWDPYGLHLRPAGYSKIDHAVAQHLRQGALEEQVIQLQHVNITKAATPSFASPARFQNPGQAYLRYNVVWTPEEWIPKYRPREAGGMDAQVQKKFAERPARAWEFERDGYAPSGSPVKMSPSVGSWRWAGCTYIHAQRACLATNLAGVPQVS